MRPRARHASEGGATAVVEREEGLAEIVDRALIFGGVRGFAAAEIGGDIIEMMLFGVDAEIGDIGVDVGHIGNLP
jgi:hypothetical protein